MTTLHTTTRPSRRFGTWAIALSAILFVAAGCEAGAGEGAQGLLGKVGSSLGGMKKSDGSLSLSGAAQAKGHGSGTLDFGRSDDGTTDDPASDPEPGTDGQDGTPDGTPDGSGAPQPSGEVSGSLTAECTAACESIVNCLLQSCPVLGSPDVEDVAAVVAECTAECESFLDVEEAASVSALSCSDIWSEMTASEPDLLEACGFEGSYDYEYEFEAEGEGEAEADWSYDSGYDDDGWYDDGSDSGDDDWYDDGSDDDYEDCDDDWMF